MRNFLRGTRYFLSRFSTERSGAVSFEYVAVAACVVASVAAGFGSGIGGNVATALINAVGVITSFLPPTA